MFPSFSSLVADFEHWASQMDSDRPKTQHSWHQLSKQLSPTYGSKLHSFFLLNIVKTTVSLQKIHLPEGKWGVLHLRKPSPFWDPTWGNPITINFAQMSSQMKSIAALSVILSVNCISDVQILRLQKETNALHSRTLFSCQKNENWE
jgi:hypothetical protein